MKYFFLLCALALGLSGCFLAVSCRPARPTATEAAPHTVAVGGLVGRDSAGQRVDSAAKQSHQAPGTIARIFNLSNGTTKQSANRGIQSTNAPKKCKNCTIVYSAGPATVTTAAKKAQVAAGAGAALTSIDKAKAPLALGGGDATDNTKAGQRGGAAAIGDGATATATTEKGISWWWLLVPAAGVAYYTYRKYFTV